MVEKEQKEANTEALDSIRSNIKVRKIEEIFKHISVKIDREKKLPDKITEQLSFICKTILDAAIEKDIYFNNSHVNFEGKWYEINTEILLDFLINIGVEYGMEEFKLNTARNRNAFLKQFNILARAITNKSSQKGKIKLPDLKENH